jgi:hypothetical protein
MSEMTTESTEQATQDPAQEPAKADVDWVSEARKWETRAKANKAAADANKAAAERLAQIEDAQKTAEERTAEAIAAAERRATEAEARATRRDIALEFGLTVAEAAHLDAMTDETAMRALAEDLAGRAKDEARTGAIVPTEGRRPGATPLNGDGLEQALRAKLGIS